LNKGNEGLMWSNILW